MLEACVLSVAAGGDTYGYEITQRIRQVFDVSESTLYPVLKRLQQSDCLTTYDSPFQGRNRRYYSITEKGREQHQFYQQEWEKYKADIDSVLTQKGGVDHEDTNE